MVKISPFKFLVMTERNIFVYEHFLSLNISDFRLFFLLKPEPPWKRSQPSFPAAPSKNWDHVIPRQLFENLIGDSTPTERGGAHYEFGVSSFEFYFANSEILHWISPTLVLWKTYWIFVVIWELKDKNMEYEIKSSMLMKIKWLL